MCKYLQLCHLTVRTHHKFSSHRETTNRPYHNQRRIYKASGLQSILAQKYGAAVIGYLTVRGVLIIAGGSVTVSGRNALPVFASVN